MSVHLHKLTCVAEQCAPNCPRTNRPTGIDGRCACGICYFADLDDARRAGDQDRVAVIEQALIRAV